MPNTIEQVKDWWNNGLISYLEAREFSGSLGYNMTKLGGNWVWFKI